jgi:antitoxin VapB
MSLNIKNEETVRLVRELADELHVSMTAAITEAVRAKLDAVHAEHAEDGVDWDKVLALAAEMREMLGEDYLDQDFDALLYDEMGLPK